MSAVSLWEAPVRDVRPIIAEERRCLVHLLDDLSPDEWTRPSAAPGWTVRDIALHLLHDDLRWLTLGRDGDVSSLIDMSDRREFVRLLAANNQRWIDGAQGLSPRVVTELLAWAGDQVDAHDRSQDLLGEGWVSWASDGPVPYWFNLAQEFTERWVHQQQMREAVGRVEDHEALLPEVLRTFVWAFPHQLRVPAKAGDQVELDLGAGGTWTLTFSGDAHWSLAERRASGDPVATLRLRAGRAWRMLTGAPVARDEVEATGPPDIEEALLQVRSIIV
jgi:uncharacterized protein (TIGR03083 family)